MSTKNEDVDIVVRLIRGEKVHCLSCKTGTYIPVGLSIAKDVSRCHCFVCDNCKERINLN